MTETILSLLTRLSEADDGARLWGRVARAYFGPDFDRLLRRRVLTECERADTWEVCPHCSCGIDRRPIQEIDGEPRAICPADHQADTTLDPDDLRSFVVDRAGLVALLALGSGLAASEVLPGLWHLGSLDSGRNIAVSLTRGGPVQRALVPFLRSLSGGAPMTVLAPEPAAKVRLHLLDGGIDLVELRSAMVLDSRGAVVLSRAALEPLQRAPRLLIERLAQRVTLDGRVLRLADQKRSLLVFFAEHALQGRQPVPKRLVEDHLWGSGVHRIVSGVRDPIRALRNALAANAMDPVAARALVENTRNGYRLDLSGKEIAIVD